MGEILFIAHRIPFPPDRGDKIRSHHILKWLAAQGPVHVACFADDPADLDRQLHGRLRVEPATGGTHARLLGSNS